MPSTDGKDEEGSNSMIAPVKSFEDPDEYIDPGLRRSKSGKIEEERKEGTAVSRILQEEESTTKN
jgi:hypothetical protein